MVVALLQAAVTAYVERHPWALDSAAVAALRGADDLVQESFLLSHEGAHVIRWARYKNSDAPMTQMRACSQAAQGLLSRLEHVRQVNKGRIRYPQGLVPFCGACFLALHVVPDTHEFRV